jgi:DNA-binding NtrC family response regulator
VWAHALSPSDLPGRGERVTPPARLVRQHERDLTTVLVVGGTPRRRLQVAFAFHRGSRSRKGAFVCVTGAHDARRLVRALRAWLLDTEPRSEAGPIAAAAGGTLFVEGLTALGPRAQHLLRTFVERCVNVPGADRTWTGRLVVGGSSALEGALANGRIAPELYDLIDKVRVDLPPHGGWLVGRGSSRPSTAGTTGA